VHRLNENIYFSYHRTISVVANAQCNIWLISFDEWNPTVDLIERILIPEKNENLINKT
jgi:hypothetical protein